MKKSYTPMLGGYHKPDEVLGCVSFNFQSSVFTMKIKTYQMIRYLI
jgi:hypothetical protein